MPTRPGGGSLKQLRLILNRNFERDVPVIGERLCARMSRNRELQTTRAPMTVLKKFLRRYTDLPSLVYLLRERCMTLVDPQSWDDTNDSHYLTLYREKQRLASVLALCFTQVTETYHHWRVFANGASGVCISFRRKELLSVVRRHGGVRAHPVRYLKMDQLEGKQLVTNDLPFLKRYPFGHENEFRFLYQTRTAKRQTIDIPIPLSCVDRVTLSPWLRDKLSSPIKDLLWSIPGCSELKIVRSTLISNEEWKQAGEDARSPRRSAAAARRPS